MFASVFQRFRPLCVAGACLDVFNDGRPFFLIFLPVGVFVILFVIRRYLAIFSRLSDAGAPRLNKLSLAPCGEVDFYNRVLIPSLYIILNCLLSALNKHNMPPPQKKTPAFSLSFLSSRLQELSASPATLAAPARSLELPGRC